ncbi:MAG: DsbA family protein [Candidatus Giovannonibacteria bacterium]|nr:MAG: DsbA family protein [Candidatus Giovannonibacteria bacterium]
MDQKVLIPGAIILAGVIVAGAVLYSNLPKNPLLGKEGKGEVIKDGADALKIQKDDFVLGNPAAKVAIIEYGDFQCPFCGRFFQTAEQEIKDKYVKTGKAVFSWRDFAFLGEESFRAAEAARCAGDEGKFWEYHDHLFNSQRGENEGAFSDQNLKRFAEELKLDKTKFNSCFDSGKYRKAVEETSNTGRAVGVNGTPATFVNGQLISGAQPFPVFQKIIDEELKK